MDSEELRQKLRDTEEKLSNTEDDLKHYKEQVEKIQNYLKEMGQQIPTKESDTIEQIEDYIKSSIKEKPGLSRLAGAHLTRDNPNIADLSDEHRPTKLGEAFTELYDNEWTDAFEELVSVGKEKENDAINKLLDLLKMVNTECSAVCKNQRDVVHNMKTVTITIDTDYDDKRINKGNDSVLDAFSMDGNSKQLVVEVTADVTISAEHEKAVSDVRRLCIKHLEEQKNISKIIASKIAIVLELDPRVQAKLVLYITKCAHLCWYMNLAKPPVYIEFEEGGVRENDIPFDSNKYKPYTRTGESLDFVVWPSLYIHKGGPMLCKGVAQGKD